MRRFMGLSIIAFELFSLPTQASSLIFEFGGGLSQIDNGSPFLSPNAPASANLGPSGNTAFLFSFGNGSSAVDLQFGVQTLLSTGTYTNEYYTLVTPYPVLRLQLSKLYIGAGLSPLVFRRTQTSPGFDGLGTATALATLGEAGFLFGITPKFSIALQADAQFISASSAGPIIDLGVVLRIYFAASTKGGAGGSAYSSNEWKGWRYPFGTEMRR